MKMRSRILIVSMLLALGMAASAAFAQKIIVNEAFRGTNLNTGDEWVELLLIEDITATQLESFYIGDSTSTPNSRYSNYKFTLMNSIATTFPKGTIIVVGGDTGIGTEDITLNTAGGDWTIKLKTNGGNISKGSNTGDLGATDVAWVDTVALGADAVGADGFSVKFGPNVGTFGTVAKVTVEGTAGTYLVFNSNLAGATTPANWAWVGSGTQGEPNGGDNTTYVHSLRGTTADNPDAGFSPSPAAFSKVSSTGTKDLVITISNSASATNNLTINTPGLNITGAGAAKFAIQGSPSFPITVTPGNTTTLTVRYTPGEVATHAASAELVSNDAHSPSLTLSGEGVLLTTVANIAAARAEAVGANVQISGTVVVTCKTDGLQTARYQFAIQDNSGADGQSAIWIDDPSNTIGQTFVVGDQLTGVMGTLTDYSSMLELTALGPCTKVGTQVPPAPKTISDATDFETYESELIRINGVTVDAGSDTVWGGTAIGSGKNYTLTPPSGVPITQVRLEEGSTLVGQSFLTGSFDIVGIAFQYSTSYQIEPRLPEDQTQRTSINDWALYQ